MLIDIYARTLRTASRTDVPLDLPVRTSALKQGILSLIRFVKNQSTKPPHQVTPCTTCPAE